MKAAMNVVREELAVAAERPNRISVGKSCGVFETSLM
jgi:hypothetical protein